MPFHLTSAVFSNMQLVYHKIDLQHYNATQQRLTLMHLEEHQTTSNSEKESEGIKLTSPELNLGFESIRF